MPDKTTPTDFANIDDEIASRRERERIEAAAARQAGKPVRRTRIDRRTAA